VIKAFDLLLERAQDVEQLRAVCEKSLRTKLAESEANRLISGAEPKAMSPDEQFEMRLLSRLGYIIAPENT
jgi:hypothetical protein